MSDDDDGVLRHVSTPADLLVAVTMEALTSVAHVADIRLHHAILLGEGASPHEDGMVAFGGAIGDRVQTQSDTVRLLDHHLAQAVRALGQEWRAYRLEGPLR